MSDDTFTARWARMTPEERAAWVVYDDASWKKLMASCREADAVLSAAVDTAKNAHAAAKEAAWKARASEMKAFAFEEDVA